MQSITKRARSVKSITTRTKWIGLSTSKGTSFPRWGRIQQTRTWWSTTHPSSNAINQKSPTRILTQSPKRQSTRIPVFRIWSRTSNIKIGSGSWLMRIMSTPRPVKKAFWGKRYKQPSTKENKKSIWRKGYMNNKIRWSLFRLTWFLHLVRVNIWLTMIPSTRQLLPTSTCCATFPTMPRNQSSKAK